MAHEVESMFYVNKEIDKLTGEVSRFVPWHGLGTPIEEACSSAEALELAGLDWEVNSRPIHTDNGIVIPGYIANTRSSDDKVLGVVSDKYKIVQNKEAFAFTDNLLDNEAKYVTAGSLRGGKNVWMLAELPETKILGDAVGQYLCFTNTHDGTGAVKCAVTNVRVVCNNTLNLALKNASRTWRCRHSSSVNDKLAEASKCLELANKYTEELTKVAERAANITLTSDDLYNYITTLLPIDDNMSDRQKRNVEQSRIDLSNCMIAIDLRPFYKTAWGFINAVSDFVYHTPPKRQTATYAENKMFDVIDGNSILNSAYELCLNNIS